MNIKYKKLAGYERKYKSGLGYDTVGMIYLYGNNDDLNEFKKHLAKLKTYNATPDLNYKDCELHLWTGDRHMQLSFKSNNNGEKRNKELYERVIEILNNKFNDSSIDVVIGEDYALSKEKIEDFLLNYTPDINEIPFNKFGVIEPSVVGFPKLSNEALNRLNEVEKDLFKSIEQQKVIVNGDMKGRFKKLGERFVFFKLRATKTYYNIELRNLRSLETY